MVISIEINAALSGVRSKLKKIHFNDVCFSINQLIAIVNRRTYFFERMIDWNQQKNYTLHRIIETKRHKKYSIDKDTQRKDAWQPFYFLLYCMIDYISDEAVQLILRFIINILFFSLGFIYAKINILIHSY